MAATTVLRPAPDLVALVAGWKGGEP